MPQPAPSPHEYARSLREAEVRRLNLNRPALARVTHDATIPFGPSLRVERYVLGNGLRVLLVEDHAAPVVAFQAWLGVGSRHEVVGKTGLAHLFEHLMFGEAEGLPMGEYTRRMENEGAYTNAATWTDWTYYQANVPSSAIGLAIELEAKRFDNLVLSHSNVDREKQVVMNERRERTEDDVDGAMNEALDTLAFTRHAYGRPTIGTMDDISGLMPEDCQRFYRTFYAPNNCVLVLAGDVSAPLVLPIIQDHYGKLRTAEIPVEDVQPEPHQTMARRTTLKKPSPSARVIIGYKSPAVGDVDHAPLDLLNEVLFGGRASRAHRALVEEQGLAAYVGGALGVFRDPYLYFIKAAAREDHTATQLVAAIDAVIEGVCRAPVTAEELERAKARLEREAMGALENAQHRAFQVGFFETIARDPAMFWQRLDRLRAATVGDLLRVARHYLVDTARSVVEVVPGEEPGAPDGQAPADDPVAPGREELPQGGAS